MGQYEVYLPLNKRGGVGPKGELTTKFMAELGKRWLHAH